MPQLLDLFRVMVRIRAFEDAAEAASQGGVSWGGAATDKVADVRVKGPLHLSTGQEAVPRACAPTSGQRICSPPRTAATATPWPRGPTRRA